MTLPTSGPISTDQVASEFGISTTFVFPNDIWGRGGLPSGVALRLPDDLWGKSNEGGSTPDPGGGGGTTPDPGGGGTTPPTPGTFTPDGGDVYGEGVNRGEVSISCNQDATWVYTPISGGSGTSVTVPSGGTTRFIGFSVDAIGSGNATRPRSASWSLTGTSGGVSRNFTVSVYASGNV